MSTKPSLSVRRKRRWIITNEEMPRRTWYRQKASIKRKSQDLEHNQFPKKEDEVGSDSSDSNFAEGTFNAPQMRLNVSCSTVCSEPSDAELDVVTEKTSFPSDQFTTRQIIDGSSSDCHNPNAEVGFEEFNSNSSATSAHSCSTSSGDCGWSSNQSVDEREYDTVDHNLELSANIACDPTGSAKKQEVLLSNPLCKCNPTTEGDVFLMCLALGIRHHLSWVAMVDILKMVNSIYGYDAVHATKYYLQKFCEVGKDHTKFHIYCPKCEAYIGERQDLDTKDVLFCACGEKVKDFSKSSSYFLSVDMETQFQQLLELPEVANDILTHRFQRVKVNPDAYEDIYDGAVYKNLSKPGSVLSDPLNFSYTFTTDGVSLGKSTGSSVWPIWAFCNELNPKLRRKHMLFAGVWVGQKDPNMRLFLKPFVELANQLSTQGVKWTDQAGRQQVSKIIPLCCICDSGARYKLLNLSSYTAYYGCTFCYHKAENTVKGRRFTISHESMSLRTQESMINDMSTAFANRNHKDQKKRVVFGQKGPTPLIKMLHLDLSKAFVVDFMHSVLLGNVRSHTLIFLEGVGQSDYYIGAPDKKFTIDQRLLSIKPPKSITRHPRVLKDVKYWKASEWRSFILYYSLVCLGGLIGNNYLSHLALLSSGMYILFKKSITVEEIKTAEKYLLKYVYYMEAHFGKTAMLYNVHLLLHVTEGVYNYGPLWTHNAFDFEGNNHRLVQMHTSPGFVAQQLAKRYLIFNSLPTLCETYASTDPPLDFVKEITGRGLKSFFRCGETVLLGKGRPFNCADGSEEADLLRNFNINHNTTCFSKFISRGIRFTTADYSNDKLNDDSYIAIHGGMKVRILHVLYVESLDEVILIVQELVLDKTPILKTKDVIVSHINRVLRMGALLEITPREITGQCLYMGIDTGKYVADIPYGSYND